MRKEINNRFYYCYHKPLADYIIASGMSYITKAIHPKTQVMFVMFDQSEELTQRILEFKQMNQEN